MFRIMTATQSRFVIWAWGIFLLLGTTVVLGLWTTRKIALIEVFIGVLFSICFWIVLPRFANYSLPDKLANGIAVSLTTVYMLSNFGFVSYLNLHNMRIERDAGLYVQSLWWTLHGVPLFNTMERTSTLGIHAYFAFFILVPLYKIWPSSLILPLIQYCMMGVAGLILYKIAKSRLDPLASLMVLVVFLLFPAYQYGFGDFYPTVLAVPFVLLTLDNALRHRWGTFIIWACVLMSVKETLPLSVALLGVYLISKKNWFIGASIMVLASGWFLAVMYITIPWFRDHYAVATPGVMHLAYFSTFGDSIPSILHSIAQHPLVIVSSATNPMFVRYLLTLIIPYLIIGLSRSFIWIVALPELMITLLSDPKRGILEGGQFVTVLAPALGLTAILTLQKLSVHLPSDWSARQFQRYIGTAMLFCTLSLLPLWINSTDLLHPVQGASELPTILAHVGHIASVATPYDISFRFHQRAIVFDNEYTPPQLIGKCARYVVLRHDHQPNALFVVIHTQGFHLIWSGTAFEIWETTHPHVCDPNVRPWI